MHKDFTIGAYEELVVAASKRFQFVRFGESLPNGEAALWRHDIDFSPQRALAVAHIEAARGVTATYFVQISSRFYSVLEPDIAAIIRDIVRLGHDIGLHFDAEVCRHQPAPDYERRMVFEAGVLEEVAEARVAAFSLHNPTTMVGVFLDKLMHSGLVNASCPALRDEFQYCSDSNGIWRFRTLAEMIADPTVTRLYALTHPEWWQEGAMHPRDKIRRCIEGRAAYCNTYYDALLATHGRPKIGAKET